MTRDILKGVGWAFVVAVLVTLLTLAMVSVLTPASLTCSGPAPHSPSLTWDGGFR